MSFFDKPFDATKVEPQGAWKPIPDGEYLCLIKSAAAEKTRDKTGEMLHLEMKVLNEGPSKNREVHWRINLENRNPQAVEIGLKQLSALCAACQLKGLSRPGEVVGKTITIKVAVVPRQDKPGEMSNEVRGIILAGDKAEAPAGAAAAAGERPPWER